MNARPQLWQQTFITFLEERPAWQIVVTGRPGPKRKTLSIHVSRLHADGELTEGESWAVKSLALGEAWTFTDRHFPGRVAGLHSFEDGKERHWSRAMIQEAFNL